MIDPLDGTTNFAHGMPFFTVSIAVAHAGELVAGGVYAPVLDEMYLASKGEGATRNGESIHVSSTATLEDALIVTGFPHDREAIIGWLTDSLGNVLRESQGVLRLGSAALDLALIAGGHAEAFYEPRLNAWDVAAGALLVLEAGGRVTRFDGSEFSVFGKETLATNGHVHDALVQVLSAYPVPPPDA